MSWGGTTRIGNTVGLSRYSDEDRLQAEQVYVDRIDSPRAFPHPDGGILTQRTIEIRRARGYAFTPVLRLTDRQAVEMAKLILESVEGSDQYTHPNRLHEALELRTQAKNVSRTLNKIADRLEGV